MMILDECLSFEMNYVMRPARGDAGHYHVLYLTV